MALNDPAIFANNPERSPGANFHGVIAAVRLIMPVDDRRQRAVFLRNLEAHETMGDDEVFENFPRRVDLKIPRWQGGEKRFEFFAADGAISEAADFFHQQFALLFLRANKFAAAG